MKVSRYNAKFGSDGHIEGIVKVDEGGEYVLYNDYQIAESKLIGKENAIRELTQANIAATDKLGIAKTLGIGKDQIIGRLEVELKIANANLEEQRTQTKFLETKLEPDKAGMKISPTIRENFYEGRSEQLEKRLTLALASVQAATALIEFQRQEIELMTSDEGINHVG